MYLQIFYKRTPGLAVARTTLTGWLSSFSNVILHKKRGVIRLQLKGCNWLDILDNLTFGKLVKSSLFLSSDITATVVLKGCMLFASLGYVLSERNNKSNDKKKKLKEQITKLPCCSTLTDQLVRWRLTVNGTGEIGVRLIWQNAIDK